MLTDWANKTLLTTFYHLELVQQYLEHAFTNYTHFYICCHLCMFSKEYWVPCFHRPKTMSIYNQNYIIYYICLCGAILMAC
jgi:hypothetical protein